MLEQAVSGGQTAGAAVADAAADAAVAGGGDPRRSEHFAFEGKVFTIENARFSLTRDSREPAFHVMLGELDALITLPTLRLEFGIAPESNDGKLLDVVEKSLRYVKEIRPGDSIPRELLDGSASWSVEPRHRQIAEQRLAVQLAAWISGEEASLNDLAALERIANDPETKHRVQEAVAELAERIGIGRERKQEVMNKVNDFARELSYIEALRERFGLVRFVVEKLGVLSKLYARDRSVTEEIVRVLQLMRAPVADITGNFQLVDAQTSEIMSVIKKYNVQVGFVREIRDELHYKISQWDELIVKWQEHSFERSIESEVLIKDAYRFAARNFPQLQSWKR